LLVFEQALVSAIPQNGQLIGHAIRPATLCFFFEQRRSAAQGLDCNLGNVNEMIDVRSGFQIFATLSAMLMRCELERHQQ
jgi:hypothetical protein